MFIAALFTIQNQHGYLPADACTKKPKTNNPTTTTPPPHTHTLGNVISHEE